MENIILTTREARRYVKRSGKVVQINGLCPICGTGRSQYGECARGHIIFETLIYEPKSDDTITQSERSASVR